MEGRGEVQTSVWAFRGCTDCLASTDVPTETSLEHPPNFLTPIQTAIVPVIACFESFCLVRNAADRHNGSEAEDPDALNVAGDDLHNDRL
jgi:hypothetical protein